MKHTVGWEPIRFVSEASVMDECMNPRYALYGTVKMIVTFRESKEYKESKQYKESEEYKRDLQAKEDLNTNI